MPARKSVTCAVIALGALTTIAASPASADAQAPRKATLSAIGGVEFKVNRHVADTMRFSKDKVTIRSGGTLTVRNRTKNPDGSPAEHTFSLVKRGDLPRSFAQMEKCFSEGEPCLTLAMAHGVTDPNAEPDPSTLKPRVEAGASGFDVAGDSAIFVEDPLKLKITAAKGTNLNYLCIIHPWMQGRVAVR